MTFNVMKLAKIFRILGKIIIYLALSAGIVYLLVWKYRLGVARYFDIDEFAHLHWGYSFFIGEKPYADFFYFFPPFFLYLLKPIFFFLVSER